MASVFRNGRLYVYKSIRQGGRVTSEYRGSGEFAMILALLDLEEREDREHRARVDRERQRQFDELEHELGELVARARTLAHGILRAAGYHRHHRGEWRRRRAKRD